MASVTLSWYPARDSAGEGGSGKTLYNFDTNLGWNAEEKKNILTHVRHLYFTCRFPYWSAGPAIGKSVAVIERYD